MNDIFISYRRVDTNSVVGRIYDALAANFGKRNVFKDVDSIPLGQDFREVVDNSLQSCNIMLVVIGNSWLSVENEDGDRRLDDENDFVRIEVEYAIKNNIPIIPVLIDSENIPSEKDLPDSLRPLAFKNAIVIRHDPDFNNDISKLIKYLKKIKVTKNNKSIPLAMMFFLVLIILAFVFMRDISSLIYPEVNKDTEVSIAITTPPAKIKIDKTKPMEAALNTADSINIIPEKIIPVKSASTHNLSQKNDTALVKTNSDGFTEVKPTVVKPAVVKPTVVKPAEVKPAEVKPAEVKPAVVKPAEVKPTVIKPAEVTVTSNTELTNRSNLSIRGAKLGMAFEELIDLKNCNYSKLRPVKRDEKNIKYTSHCYESIKPHKDPNRKTYDYASYYFNENKELYFVERNIRYQDESLEPPSWSKIKENMLKKYGKTKFVGLYKMTSPSGSYDSYDYHTICWESCYFLDSSSDDNRMALAADGPHLTVSFGRKEVKYRSKNFRHYHIYMKLRNEAEYRRIGEIENPTKYDSDGSELDL